MELLLGFIASFLVGVFFITLICFCVCVHKRNVSSINEREEKDGVYDESSVVGINMITNAAYGYLQQQDKPHVCAQPESN